MSPWLPLVLTLPTLTLLATGLLPNRWANAHVGTLRSMVTRAAAIQCVIALALAIAWAADRVPTTDVTLLSAGGLSGWFSLGVYLDGVSALMLSLVSFVGWVICRYSVRYLDGEASQGRYFRWTAMTIGAVSWMVVSNNLLMFLAFWITTSLCLHQLLLHYGHRPAAKRSAWKKFAISRLGDVALVLATVLFYLEFQTLQFSELFTEIAASGGAAAAHTQLQVAAWLLMLGAVTKSAQFPFHTWLPETMETPTPISALMHAGIVNAGGYLIIRMSPLVSLAPAALTTLAIIGAFTACFAAVIMLTQSSVKRSLAYSTIAQMGFMMLQCGLGAFSAAMLHILAHSLYKAHAFLSSGSVLDQVAATRGIATPQPIDSVSWGKVLLAGAMNVSLLLAALAAVGYSPWTKPGGVLLGFVLCLALTHFVSEALATGKLYVLARSLVLCGVLCLSYAVSFALVDHAVASSLPAVSAPTAAWLVAAVTLAGFGGVFLLQRLSVGSQPAWMQSFYVHASNGFYLDAWLRRRVSKLVSA